MKNPLPKSNRFMILKNKFKSLFDFLYNLKKIKRHE